MKKPLSLGFSLMVDGYFKTHFDDEAVAKIAAAELLSGIDFLRSKFTTRRCASA